MKFLRSAVQKFSKLSTREKGILLAGGGAVLLFGAFYFFLFPLFDELRRFPDEIAEKTKLLRKYREREAQRETRQQSLESAQKHLAELESRLMRTRTAASAQAQLQEFVNDLAKQTQLQVNRSDFLPVKELSKDYERVSVRVDAIGTINQITGFLVAARSVPTFVLTDDLRISNYSGMGDAFKKTKQIPATIVVSGVIHHE
jgi:type II secretory pathway component PulM